MPSNLPSQSKNLTKVLSSPALTVQQLQQIHAQLLSQPPSLTLSNSLLSAYASSSRPTDAFTLFKSQIHPSNKNPNSFTFQSLLKSSSKCRSIAQTTQLHSLILKLGLLNCTSCTRIQNAFLKAYLACGRLDSARSLFDEMPHRDVVSFNTVITGYFEVGHVDLAAEMFERVLDPSRITWTAMITGYCNYGDVSLARKHFDEMPEKDLVAWNAMISGYVHNQQPLQALELFDRMQLENFEPNRVTVVSVLSACASLGALDAGKWVHVYVNKRKFRLDPFLGSALIDMYAKCGAIELALDIFGRLKENNTCTWNAMINGLALNGHAKRALGVFDQMQLDRNARPDEVTFVGVLMACSHGGFLEEGKIHFYCTLERYGVNRILEHYACMADLLCRCGLLKEAEDVIRQMPMKPDVVVWRALLGGCKIHKNVELAEKIISEMEAHGSGDCVLLSNLYASVGRWKEVEKLRRSMKNKGIDKRPGCSSIEINNMIHEFISGNNSHPRYNDICAELEELAKQMYMEGYRAETFEVLYDIDEEEKEQTGSWLS